MLADAQADLTAFAALPREHGHKVWSNNPIERLNRETWRRANVAGVFLDRQCVTRPIGAVLLKQHEEWQYSERRYLSDISIRKLIHTLTDHDDTTRPQLPSPSGPPSNTTQRDLPLDLLAPGQPDSPRGR